MNTYGTRSARNLDRRTIDYSRKNLDRLRNLQTEVSGQKAQQEEAKRKRNAQWKLGRFSNI